MSHGGSWGARYVAGGVGEVQRKRVLDAVVAVVAEHGVAGATVRLVVARAGVSSRTFYECFGGLEECLVAVIEGALERVSELVSETFAGERTWQGGMRAALAAVLGYFDAERDLARVLIVETPGAGPVVRERRERAIGAFRALVVAWLGGAVSHPSPLAPEGVLASVMSIVGVRLMVSEPEPLVGLLGPLMGIIVGPFMDEAGVAREIEKGNELAREILANSSSASAAGGLFGGAGVEIPIVLRDPRAHRVRECLCYVAGHPGVSNGEIGRGIGVGHRGRVTVLLGQLSSLGLLVKDEGGPGRANAWWTTVRGYLIVRALEGER